MRRAGPAALRDPPPLAEPALALAAVWTLLLAVPTLAVLAGGERDASLLASFGAAVAVAWLVRPPRNASVHAAARLGGAALAAMAGWLGYAACVAFIARIGLSLGLVPLAARPPAAGSPALWIASVALAPVFEEILYRGQLLGALRARLGALPALAVTSALFAVSHVDKWSMLATVLIGLVLGGVRLAGAPLATCIALHAGLNLAAIVCGGPPERLALAPGASAVAGAIALGASLWLTIPALALERLSAQRRALRNRALTVSVVAVYLVLAASALPAADARATFHHYFVLTLGYGHLLGAALLSRRRLAVPSGVPIGLWRAFLWTGGVTLFAAYGVAIQHGPTLVLALLAFSTWHTAENDLALGGAYAHAGRLGPIPRALGEQLGSIGVALLVLAVAANALTPLQLEETVRGTLLAGAGFGVPCGAAALCGLVLAFAGGRGRERAPAEVFAGLALVAGSLMLAVTRPRLAFGDVFAATTLYHLVSWLVLLADRARLEPALAGPLMRRVLAVHLPAAFACVALLALPVAVVEPLGALVFSPGIYLFFSVLHGAQTAAARGLAASSRRTDSPAAAASAAVAES